MAEEIEAGRDWFLSFKERCHLSIMKIHDEAAGAEVETAAKYPEDPVRTIDEGGYTT